MEAAVSAGAAFSFVARRNCSLTARERSLAFGLILAVPFAIASAFALFGAWLILPFAGLEMGALYLAFRWIERHAGDFECLTVEGDRVTLESVDAARVRRFEFNRCWAQVILDRDPASGHSRLALRSHGREVEFGVHLTEGERAWLAGELGRKLGAR